MIMIRVRYDPRAPATGKLETPTVTMLSESGPPRPPLSTGGWQRKPEPFSYRGGRDGTQDLLSSSARREDSEVSDSIFIVYQE